MPGWVMLTLLWLSAVAAAVAAVEALMEPKAFRRANFHGIVLVSLLTLTLVLTLDAALRGRSTTDVAALAVGLGLGSVRHLARWKLAQPGDSSVLTTRWAAGWGTHLIALAATVMFARVLEDPAAAGFFITTYVLVVADERWRPKLP
jgi:hypothetical protein